MYTNGYKYSYLFDIRVIYVIIRDLNSLTFITGSFWRGGGGKWKIV